MALSPGNSLAISNMFSGLLGLTNNPYKNTSNQYKKYATQGASYQMPFYTAGVNALSPYQTTLNKFSDPQAYYNNIMGSYNESPYAQYEQQQAMNAANNSASASGLTGSTPLAMQEEQTAEDISSKDMDKYFANMMGIDEEYLSGLSKLISGGQLSANELTKMSELMMELTGRAEFGSALEKGSSENALMAGLGELTGIFGF